MPLIQFGSLVTGVRGSLNGITFSKNAGGPYIKNHAAPTSPDSESQQGARKYFALAAVHWNTLSAAQRALWDAFAADPPEYDVNPFGQTRTLTGLQWFQRLNARFVGLNQYPQEVPPESVPIAAPVIQMASFGSYEASYPDAWIKLSGTPANMPPVVHVNLKISPRKGAYSSKSGFRMAYYEGTPQGGVIQFGRRIPGLFGAFPDGWVAFVEVRFQSLEGIRSPAASVRIDIPTSRAVLPYLTLNSDFEKAWTAGTPPNWITVYNNPCVPVVDSESVFRGGKSLRISSIATPYQGIHLTSNYFSVTQGQAYLIRVSYRNSAAKACSCNMRWAEASSTQLMASLPSTKWVSHVFVATAPVTSSVARLYFYSSVADEYSLELDDCSVAAYNP